MSATEIGQQFVQHYYNCFDNDKKQLQSLYDVVGDDDNGCDDDNDYNDNIDSIVDVIVDIAYDNDNEWATLLQTSNQTNPTNNYANESHLTYEKNSFKGQAKIMEFFGNLNMQVKRQITSFDCQPTPNGVLVLVTGNMSIDGNPPLKFTQVFNLYKTAASYILLNDFFRLNESSLGQYFGFDHVTFWVGNALQAAQWYCARFGFENVAYRGLETGDREYVTHVIKLNDIFMAFVSPLTTDNTEFGKHMQLHGDGVKDVAFQVDDVAAIYKAAVAAGAKSIREPYETKDENGNVTIATIMSPYGDTTHSFVDRRNYKGAFLPGYSAKVFVDPLSKITTSAGLLHIDHVVSNHADQMMTPVVEWYEKVLKFHRFWSVDDKTIHTEYSSLRSIVVTDQNEKVKLPINEPANGKKKSQIQEYVDFYAGGGVQHIALRTNDIIQSVSIMKQRGVQFLSVPASYYVSLREKLAHAPITVKEDLDKLEALHILIDYDDKGYLLQIFTKNVEDRPTVFFEVIQRNGHEGFGAGNFRALFEAIEREQEKRGNFTTSESSTTTL
ncbi:4-hydroxyphenylpyruvate dioxygenase [Cavenderia fasciculata]|uniref:4-hydroxyphenylpyruvate dioxygenase n=1 Tax=Cavenderia fasciculata TaxID=261658 RepID=F4Q0Y0_CACFS|nr:4-hydroxyphenylpyruvate dioxygenase [Cavenderia fasciculata]EGG18481.1 4-hydroxyphenylpyruvate dioxygenase [Cavenderia fasciculata]|eukprot:XP_004366385.1 4-hydroxyphenylpyruvate dioxygenase [Cavenderia fasciculata]